jgi:hypothetical protein
MAPFRATPQGIIKPKHSAKKQATGKDHNMRRPILSILTAVSLVGVGHASDTQNQDFGAVPVVSRDTNRHTESNPVSPLESASEAVRKLFMRTDQPGVVHAKPSKMGTRNPCLGKSLHIVDNWGC